MSGTGDSQASSGSAFIFQIGSLTNLSFDKRDEVLCWELESFIKKGHWYPDSWCHQCDSGSEHMEPLPVLEQFKILGEVLQTMSAPKNDVWENPHGSFRTKDLWG